MFDDILNTLNTSGRGSQGYTKAIEVALAGISSDPERAAGYLLLIVQAERFIENTGRLAVTAAQTGHAYDHFAANTSALKTAYATGDTGQVLAALNAVSTAILAPFDPSFPTFG